jgi:hypothetical protein
MSKKIAIAVFILILVGAGVYLFLKKPQTSNNLGPVDSQNKATNGTVQGTLNSLLSAGKSQKCTYSNEIDSASMNGVVYVSNGKVRGDYVSASEEMMISGHMIYDGKYSYVWTDGSKSGIKMAIDQEQQKQQEQSADNSVNNQAADMNKTFTYNCQGWARDESVFVPPSDVSFSTFEMPSAQPSNSVPLGNEESVNQSACAACDNVPEGIARDTCKSQLNCQ